MALEEDRMTGVWQERSVCMGDKKTCSFPGLINHYHKFIISFAEDEAGELYFLATTYPSSSSPSGTVFKFMDPSRRAPPGKCKQKPLPVKVKGKRFPFAPRELTVLDTKEKPTRPPPRKFKFTTKPLVTSNQVKPTTTTTTTEAKMTPTSSAVKLKIADKEASQKKKLKPEKKNKMLNKQEAKKQMKTKRVKPKPNKQPKKTAAKKPVVVKDKIKSKRNQTNTENLDDQRASNSLKDNKIHTKRKSPPRKAAPKQPGLKIYKRAKEHVGLVNKTMINLNAKSNRTTRPQLQVKRRRARDIKAL